MKLRLAGLSLVLSTGVMALTSNMIDFNGYMRSGTGTTTNASSPMQKITLNDGLPMGRLGNENDMYGELEMRFHLAPKEKKEIWDTKLRLSLQTSQVQTNEAYAELGNWDASPIVYWAGLRLYRENDIHIVDEWQFNMPGTGAGVEKVPFLFGNLNLAYIKQNNNTYLDMRVREIDMPLLGQTMIWAAYADAYGTGSGNNLGTAPVASQGFGAGIQFSQKWTQDISNQLTIRGGNGVMSVLNSYGKASNSKADSATAFRVTDQTFFKLMPSLELSTALDFESRNYKTAGGAIISSDSQASLFSVTGRPVYFFNDHHSLAVEGSYGSNGNGQSLTRVTIAPQIHPKADFWSRPSIRAFYSHNFWSGMHPSGFTSNSTNGGQYGVQAEVFF